MTLKVYEVFYDDDGCRVYIGMFSDKELAELQISEDMRLYGARRSQYTIKETAVDS